MKAKEAWIEKMGFVSELSVLMDKYGVKLEDKVQGMVRYEGKGWAVDVMELNHMMSGI